MVCMSYISALRNRLAFKLDEKKIIQKISVNETIVARNIQNEQFICTCANFSATYFTVSNFFRTRSRSEVTVIRTVWVIFWFKLFLMAKSFYNA